MSEILEGQEGTMWMICWFCTHTAGAWCQTSCCPSKDSGSHPDTQQKRNVNSTRSETYYLVVSSTGTASQQTTRMLWSSSGQRQKLGWTCSIIPTHVFQCHHDLCEAHQQVSPEVSEWRSLVLASCFLKAAIQHPGISSPVSLLRHSSAGVMWMWRTSIFGSSPGCLALSTTVATSQLIEWWSFQACCTIADFSSIPLWHAFQYSFSLVSSLLLVSRIYSLPQLQVILYTTLGCFSTGKGSIYLGQHQVEWPSRCEDHLHTVPPADPPDVFGYTCCVW